MKLPPKYVKYSEKLVTLRGIFGWPLTVGPIIEAPIGAGAFVICERSFSLAKTPGDKSISAIVFMFCYKYVKKIQKLNIIT